jgi:hypothetical protein
MTAGFSSGNGSAKAGGKTAKGGVSRGGTGGSGGRALLLQMLVLFMVAGVFVVEWLLASHCSVKKTPRHGFY